MSDQIFIIQLLSVIEAATDFLLYFLSSGGVAASSPRTLFVPEFCVLLNLTEIIH